MAQNPEAPIVAIRARVARRMTIAGVLLLSPLFIGLLTDGASIPVYAIAIPFLLGVAVLFTIIPLYACPRCGHLLFIKKHVRGPGVPDVCTNCGIDLREPLPNRL